MFLKLLLLCLYGLFQLYFTIIIISFILSWIPSANNFKFCRLINKVSNWYMEPFRGKLILGIFDMGSLVGIIILETIIGFIYTCMLMF